MQVISVFDLQVSRKHKLNKDGSSVFRCMLLFFPFLDQVYFGEGLIHLRSFLMRNKGNADQTNPWDKGIRSLLMKEGLQKDFPI